MTANPVGASCARVCPTEELCEGACVLNHSTKPIMIGNLQRYATDWAIENEQAYLNQESKWKISRHCWRWSSWFVGSKRTGSIRL